MLKTPFPSRLHRLSVLKAAFGMALPEDEESTADEFADATHFSTKGRAYAEGGRVYPDADLGPKKEAETGVAIDDPNYQLPVYRGENAKARAEAQAKPKRPKDMPAVASAENHADGGEVGGDSDEDEAAERGKQVSAAAIDSTNGTLKQAADAARAHNKALEDAERLAAGYADGGMIRHILAASRHARGGEIENPRPTFADAMVRRMKFGRGACR